MENREEAVTMVREGGTLRAEPEAEETLLLAGVGGGGTAREQRQERSKPAAAWRGTGARRAVEVQAGSSCAEIACWKAEKGRE